MSHFTVLKLNDTELLNFATELFFFKGQRFRVEKVQSFFLNSANFGSVKKWKATFVTLPLPLKILQLILIFILTDRPKETYEEKSVCSRQNSLSVVNSVCIRRSCIIVPKDILTS